MDDSRDALAAAAARMNRALALLEARLDARRAASSEGELFDHDRARLASDLEAERARRRTLEEAASDASHALARAAAAVREALANDFDAPARPLEAEA